MELKKCPACGGEARYIGKQVMCCKCSYTIFEHGSTEAAIKAWNNQPRIEELKQRNKELKQEVKELRQALAQIQSTDKFEYLQQIATLEQALKEEEAEVKLQTILLNAYKHDQKLLKNSLTKMLDLIESYRTEVIDFELHKAVLGFDGMKQIEQAEQLLLLKGGE